MTKLHTLCQQFDLLPIFVEQRFFLFSSPTFQLLLPLNGLINVLEFEPIAKLYGPAPIREGLGINPFIMLV